MFKTGHQALGGVHLPAPFPSARPSGDHQVLHKLKSWGVWFYHQESSSCKVLLGKKKKPYKDHDGFIRHNEADCVQQVTSNHCA